MRILIHAVSAHDMGGAARHLMGFLPALEQVGQDHEYVLCINDRLTIAPLPSNFHVRRLSMQSAWQRLWWDQVALPRLALEEHADVVLALLSFGSARPSCPQIVFLRNPIFCKCYLLGTTAKQKLDITIRRWLLYFTVRASKLVVVPSMSAWHMIASAHPDLWSKEFRVLPHAFDREKFLGGSNLPETIEHLMPPHREDTPLRLLYSGHILPYKGFEVLLEATRLLKARGIAFKLYLTIARDNWPEGFDRWIRAVCSAGLQDQIILLGHVPAEAMHHLYSRADILLFPSLCETFGWPLVEAMCLGLPIVVADTELAREVAGPAALYYPPTSANAAADRILELWSQPALRESIGHIGLNRVMAHISWQEYAETCLSYLKVLKRDGGNFKD